MGHHVMSTGVPPTSSLTILRIRHHAHRKGPGVSVDFKPHHKLFRTQRGFGGRDELGRVDGIDRVAGNPFLFVVIELALEVSLADERADIGVGFIAA